MSRYSSDSDRAYIPVMVNAITGDRTRDRRPFGLREPIDNNFFLDFPDSRRERAAGTGGAAQPINVLIRVKRSRSRRRGSSGGSSSSSDRSAGGRHQRSRDFDADDLSYHLRRELDFAREVRRDERSWSRERERIMEKDRWEDEYEERKKKEMRERERLEEEYEEKKKKEQKEKGRIIAEAKEKEEKDKKEQKAFRKKILEEEGEKKKLEKEEKELDEERVEATMRQILREAGYSKNHIDDILYRKREVYGSNKERTISRPRPTFMKVHRKYLSLDTLDYYRLPWEWDKHNSEYIIIKKYIDHNLQDELFLHTKMLKRKKYIPSYRKDVKVTLKPRENLGEKDHLFLVRNKIKSSGRNRRASWMASQS